eukprot:g6189.t1
MESQSSSLEDSEQLSELDVDNFLGFSGKARDIEMKCPQLSPLLPFWSMEFENSLQWLQLKAYYCKKSNIKWDKRAGIFCDGRIRFAIVSRSPEPLVLVHLCSEDTATPYKRLEVVRETPRHSLETPASTYRNVYKVQLDEGGRDMFKFSYTQQQGPPHKKARCAIATSEATGESDGNPRRKKRGGGGATYWLDVMVSGQTLSPSPRFQTPSRKTWERLPDSEKERQLTPTSEMPF